MEFGLWIEPEMVNADTKLFKEHPDWVIHFPGKQKTTGRNQYVLNFAMKEVQDWAIDWILGLLRNHKIDFFKWDMNRYISEPGWAGEAIEKQKTIWVRFVYGVYRVFAAIKEHFPGVYVQNCASGGGRVDMGLMRYCDVVTLTDCGNRWDRIKILWGYTQLFAPFTAGAAWRSRMWGDPAPSAAVMAGMRHDPRKCDAETKAAARKINEEYVKVRRNKNWDDRWHIVHVEIISLEQGNWDKSAGLSFVVRQPWPTPESNIRLAYTRWPYQVGDEYAFTLDTSVTPAVIAGQEHRKMVPAVKW